MTHPWTDINYDAIEWRISSKPVGLVVDTMPCIEISQTVSIFFFFCLFSSAWDQKSPKKPKSKVSSAHSWDTIKPNWLNELCLCGLYDDWRSPWAYILVRVHDMNAIISRLESIISLPSALYRLADCQIGRKWALRYGQIYPSLSKENWQLRSIRCWRKVTHLAEHINIDS